MRAQAATPAKKPAIPDNLQSHAGTALHLGWKSGERGGIEDQ
jgi:hypothetical protein